MEVIYDKTMTQKIDNEIRIAETNNRDIRSITLTPVEFHWLREELMGLTTAYGFRNEYQFNHNTLIYNGIHVKRNYENLKLKKIGSV